MQYLRNQWSDFKNSWTCLILTVLWIQRYTMYPLHLNYATTLPRKTITMKITMFIIVFVLKSNETWKFDISHCHSLFEDVFKVFSVQLPVLLGIFRCNRAISQTLLTFLVSKCLETGAEVSQSVLMPKCLWPKCPVTKDDTGRKIKV